MPTQINPLKGISLDKRKEVLISEFKVLGAKKFDIKLSAQAKEIIANYGENFPLEHFKTWWIKNYAQVNGSQLHKYLTVEDGFIQGVK